MGHKTSIQAAGQGSLVLASFVVLGDRRRGGPGHVMIIVWDHAFVILSGRMGTMLLKQAEKIVSRFKPVAINTKRKS